MLNKSLQLWPPPSHLQFSALMPFFPFPYFPPILSSFPSLLGCFDPSCSSCLYPSSCLLSSSTSSILPHHSLYPVLFPGNVYEIWNIHLILAQSKFNTVAKPFGIKGNSLFFFTPPKLSVINLSEFEHIHILFLLFLLTQNVCRWPLTAPMSWKPQWVHIKKS